MHQALVLSILWEGTVGTQVFIAKSIDCSCAQALITLCCELLPSPAQQHVDADGWGGCRENQAEGCVWRCVPSSSPVQTSLVPGALCGAVWSGYT